MKTLFAVALAFVAVNGFAAEGSITKSVKPPRVNIGWDGIATSRFFISTREFPGAMLAAPKKLKSIQWETTHFPDNTGEEVDICYLQPGRIDPDDCVVVHPNSSGVVEEFNSLKFDWHTEVWIRHKTTGGKNSGASAGMDKIVINYSY